MGSVMCRRDRHKVRLAHPKAILVDDGDGNIEKFNQRGGNGVIFPSYWNSGGTTDNPMAVVLDRIEALVS